MNILTYLRVSTDLQTVEPQRMELAGYCQRQGWSPIAEYSDVISGSKASREGLDKMLDRCRNGGIDAVLVVKLDRLGRSVLNVVKLVKDLSSMGTAVICTSQGIDTRDSNPCGKMILSVMAAFSEFERDIIRERTVAGMNVARAAGKQIGRVSTRMPADRAPIVWQWRREGGTYAVLGAMLGGVSAATAMRVDRKVPVEVEAALIAASETVLVVSPSPKTEEWA